MHPIWFILCLILGVALGIAIGLLVNRARAVAAEARVAELRSALETQDARHRGDTAVLRELAPVRGELQQLRVVVQELEGERLELHGRLS